jgi:hypothetical protein
MTTMLLILIAAVLAAVLMTAVQRVAQAPARVRIESPRVRRRSRR